MADRLMDPAVAAAVADAHRQEWAFVLAAAARITRDLDVAEECAQDAYARALTSWATDGIPAKPGAWLTTVARRRALDLIRRDDSLRGKLSLLVSADPAPGADCGIAADDDIPDDRLRLIFTCCHPALAPDARVALTLRLLCGLSTADVAHAFLVSESTMAARITRAKKKIAAAHIPYKVPPAEELQDRIGAVLDVVHLVFATGHTAPTGDQLQRRELVERALHLARILHKLLPDQPGPAGLLALILLTDARRDARTTPDGKLARLAEQDRSRWDQGQIREGLTLVEQAMRRRPASRYPLMAAIAALHAQAPNWSNTEWLRIAELYDVLVQVWPSPVVALNRAIAIGEAHGARAGLDALDQLATEPQLVAYPYLAAARGEFLDRLQRTDEARTAYREALLLAENTVEREFLQNRLGQLER